MMGEPYDLSRLIGGFGLVLGAVEPHQHDGGLGTGRGAVQLKAAGGAPEHADGGQFLRNGVVGRGGGGPGHCRSQQQGRGQYGQNAFHGQRSSLFWWKNFH
jgi:hypothetical protein